MRKKEITEKDYKKYLDMSYEEFRLKTHMQSRYDCGSYNYCINEEDDSKENRLSYIDYLVNEKGYML